MKKFLILIITLFALPVFADTLPFYINQIPKTAIGLYQTGKNITLYSHPDANSKIIKQMDFSYKHHSMPEDTFAVLLNERELGFMYVTDIDEDGWIEVVYNKATGDKGWVKTEDKMQFLPWINFYNLYGRKYGIRILKDTPKDLYTLYSKSEDLSQPISTLKYVQKSKLTKVSGNWLLVTIMDMDKSPKTGWLKWRNNNGVIYAFPDIK